MQADFLTVADGTRLRIRRAAPAAPRAIVQISHGMAEHSGRYRRFAEALCGAGFAVIAHDHRGHGETAATPADFGFFAERDGWAKVVADLGAVQSAARAAWPGIPVLLFAHSMGSFVAQDFIAGQGATLAGVVLCGSNGTAPRPVGRLVARIERLRLGARGHSRLMTQQVFGAFNQRFPNPRTEFDWLTRDPAEVDAYIADPLCGFDVTTQFWIDLLDALARICSDRHRRGVPKGLPILLTAGDADPLSDGGRGLEPLVAGYRRVGVASVASRLYPGARHELLNETNRDEVTADILRWMELQLAADRSAVPDNQNR
ncbi:alpha/beta fold hydrolase [Desertibaculum subflavum]|uniref:alpha/beta fold hydrolase n=1 Tax=Desertibaculum subflavum TaxID=2268458 RepID=UPI000E66D896